MKNQPEITEDDMKGADKAAAAITEEEMKGEDKAAAAITEEKYPILFRPTASRAGIPSSSHNLENLVDIFSIGPLSDANMASISNYDRETFISIHNRALEKFYRIATGDYFSISEGNDEFHRAQTPYKKLGRRRDLVVVSLDELIVDEPNEFMVLYGELCVDPFMFGRIYTVMKEADTENGIALSIVAPDVLFTDQSYAKEAFPKGTKIALKQPRLVKALDGFKWLDVDNPMFIEIIHRFPQGSPTKFQDWFDNGRRAHDAEEWDACVRNYTKCEIVLSRSENLDSDRLPVQLSLRFQLHSNRSRAYIELGRFSDALQDAITCCEISFNLSDSLEMMMQGIRLRIESLISLGRYKAAYWSLNAILFSESSETSQSLLDFYRQKCIEYYRMGEAIVGIAESPKYCKPDADFIGPVEIKKSGNGHDRGLFATEFVKTGTVLLVCRALARCDSSHSFMRSPMANGLVRNVRDAINREGDRALMLFLSFDNFMGNLFKGYAPTLPNFALEYDHEKQSTSRNIIVREPYEKLGTEGILRILNGIAFDDMSLENGNNWMNPSENRCCYGIWLIPSLINHSCLPNASRINVGDFMSIHASKDIDKGEEITIPYFNVLFPYHVRQFACMMRRFTCVCKRCELEKNVMSLDVPKAIYEKFYSAYLESGLSKRIRDSVKSSIDVEGWCKISEELDGWLESQEGMVGKVDSMWIRSSFLLLYLARLRLNLDECDSLEGYEEQAYKKYLNNLTIVKEAVVETCPGDIRHLLLDCRNLEIYRKLAVIHPEYEGFYERILKLNKSCDSVYGCQNPKIVKTIISKLSNTSILGD